MFSRPFDKNTDTIDYDFRMHSMNHISDRITICHINNYTIFSQRSTINHIGDIIFACTLKIVIDYMSGHTRGAEQ